MNATVLQSGETILFIGDSITDCGRLDANKAPKTLLGVGYVNYFSHMQTLREPQKNIRYINRGISGNTAEDLNSRWQDDVIIEKPDWLSVKIGINDCNCFLNNPTGKEKQSVQKYEDYLDQCLTLTREQLPQTKILLITPFYLSQDKRGEASYRGRVVAAIADYQAVVKKMAERFDARLLDSQAAFDAFLDSNRLPSDLSHDMIHLNELGSLLLAEAVYGALS